MLLTSSSLRVLDPAGDSAMEIYDDGGVTFLANVLPPDLVGNALPRKMHTVHTRNENREVHLPKQFLLLMDEDDAKICCQTSVELTRLCGTPLRGWQMYSQQKHVA